MDIQIKQSGLRVSNSEVFSSPVIIQHNKLCDNKEIRKFFFFKYTHCLQFTARAVNTFVSDTHNHNIFTSIFTVDTL